MPVYDYKCTTHGLFYELAAMDESGKPCACPTCGQTSARVIMLAPEFLSMKSENRKAHARNEKATHEPVFSTPEYRQEQQARREHKHGKACGCGDKPIRKSALMFTAGGNKMFPSMRPWMISH
ncbi:MAG: zinc ribbon domain-containing protein [Pseudomonadota bacterium]